MQSSRRRISAGIFLPALKDRMSSENAFKLFLSLFERLLYAETPTPYSDTQSSH